MFIGSTAPLSFKNDFFDGIYSFSVLTHIHPKDHRSWYEELYRILKPGGKALLTIQGDVVISSGLVSNSAVIKEYKNQGWAHIDNGGHYKNVDLVSPKFTKKTIKDIFKLEDYQVGGYQNMDFFIVSK